MGKFIIKIKQKIIIDNMGNMMYTKMYQKSKTGKAGKMRIAKTEVFQFDELNESAKEEVLKNMYDLNVNNDWWDCIYDDAKTVGLGITEFGLCRRTCQIVLNGNIADTIKDILINHGKNTSTYLMVVPYEKRLKTIQEKEKRDDVKDDESSIDGDYENLTDDFLRDIEEEYREILQHEYDYLTGKDAIIETIQANEYEFTIDGKLF